MNRRELLLGSLGASGLALIGPRSARRAPEDTTQVTPALGHAAGFAAREWPARWITAPEAAASTFGVYHFRRILELPLRPAKFVVHVSGDNRYQLYVNGRRVLWGPARGDVEHWRYETIDLAQYLTAGRNVLAAVVWNFAAQAPEAQIMFRPGFLLQGDGEDEKAADTGTSWKVLRNEGYSLAVASLQDYFAASPGEKVDGARYPWDWETLDYDDSGWAHAMDGGSAAGADYRNTYGLAPTGWKLTPRSIPLPEERPERLRSVRRSEGPQLPAAFPSRAAEVTIPAHTSARYLLDQTYLTTGYPELVTSGGRDASTTLRYAEALVGPGRMKGNRNDTEGKEIAGIADEFISDGGLRRSFRPLWWRTWRYMELAIETRDEPLMIHNLSATYVGYPFIRTAKFEANEDPSLKNIQEVGWRTARLCAHETYMDCPYWEQLQYVGDSRIQALISIFNTGDTRLARNLIEQVNQSRNLEGLTMSRYPTRSAQYIPGFSLFWIGIVHDYSRYADDGAFVHAMLPGVRDVLSYFESLETSNGLLGPIPKWQFMDWVDAWPSGNPPQDANGTSACFVFLHIMALNWAADLEATFGIAGLANYYRERAKLIGVAAQAQYWDAGRRLYSDTPTKTHWSQHANVLAVLAGVAPSGIAADLILRVMEDKSLAQCSIYFSHYLFTALNRVGEGDRYLPQLAGWRRMIDLYGLTTFPEEFETATRSPRSDCHAWSASPIYELLHTVLGVDSAAPNFARVLIRPFLGQLTRVSGAVSHPKGKIVVELIRAGNNLNAAVTLPAGVPGEFVWRGKWRALQSGANVLRL